MNTKGKRVAEGNWEIVTDPYILLMKKVEKKKKTLKVFLTQLYLIVTPWTVAQQATLSMEFRRQ